MISTPPALKMVPLSVMSSPGIVIARSAWAVRPKFQAETTSPKRSSSSRTPAILVLS